jgi:hypothetical protein
MIIIVVSGGIVFIDASVVRGDRGGRGAALFVFGHGCGL